MKAVVFNDYCCLGNCALKGNLAVLMQNGIEVVGIPTKIFSSHMGYSEYISFETPRLNEIKSLIDKNVDANLIYIGYLDSKNQYEIVREYIKDKNTKIILDPILGDNGKKYSGVLDEQISFYRELLKFSDVVTPNLTESILLTDYYKDFLNLSREDVENIAKKLFELGAKEVIIKGYLENEMLNTFYYNGIKNGKWFKVEKINTKICGTGDAFSSLLAVELLKKRTISSSIDKIQKLLFKSIKSQDLHNGLNEIKTVNLKIK